RVRLPRLPAHARAASARNTLAVDRLRHPAHVLRPDRARHARLRGGVLRLGPLLCAHLPPATPAHAAHRGPRDRQPRHERAGAHSPLRSLTPRSTMQHIEEEPLDPAEALALAEKQQLAVGLSFVKPVALLYAVWG